MAINLDSYDTKVPPGGIEIELRGEKFKIRKQHVSEGFKSDPGFKDVDKMKEQLCYRLFEVEMGVDGAPALDEDGNPIPTTAGQKEFDRFWAVISSEDKKKGVSPLSMPEILELSRIMVDVSKGYVDDDGNPIPKGKGSARR